MLFQPHVASLIIFRIAIYFAVRALSMLHERAADLLPLPLNLLQAQLQIPIPLILISLRLMNIFGGFVVVVDVEQLLMNFRIFLFHFRSADQFGELEAALLQIGITASILTFSLSAAAVLGLIKFPELLRYRHLLSILVAVVSEVIVISFFKNAHNLIYNKICNNLI